MRKLVEHYKLILNELMSMEDLVKQRGEAGALEQAKRDRDRLQRFATSRREDYLNMDATNQDRFTSLVQTRLPSVSKGPVKYSIQHKMETTTDHAGRQMVNIPPSSNTPISSTPIKAVYGNTVYDNKDPKSSTLNTAGIWLPGKDKTADTVRQNAHRRLDVLRKVSNSEKREKFGPITRPPTAPDA